MPHEFDGKKYEKASSHQKQWGAKLIEELDLQGTERILDLGCGDGGLTLLLAEQVPDGEVLGIDASRGMIEVAFTRQRKNLRFQLLDINDIDFSEEFDLVFSNAALHWILDHERLLENVYRALRSGGRLRFNFAGDGNCSNFFKVVREAMALPQFAPSFAAFEWPWYMPSVEQYQVLAKSCDFQKFRVWGENADRYFPDQETLIRWVDQPSLVPFLACLQEDDKSPFRDYVVRRMIEETRQEDGRCFETFRRINLSAEK